MTKAVLAALFAASFAGAQIPRPQDPSSDPAALVEIALRRASLTPTTARFDPALLPLFRQGEFITPLYSALSSDPWLAPAFANARRRELLANAKSPNEILNYGAAMAGFGTRRALIGDPIAYASPAKLGSLEGELKLIATTGLLKGKAKPPTGVPKPVKDAAAMLIEVARRSVEMRRLALAGISQPKRLFARLALARPEDNNLTGSSENTLAFRSIQPVYMAAAGHDLALAMQKAREMVASVPRGERYSYRAATDWGVIRLSGGGDTTYEDEPNFLTIDTGGNDTYVNAASTASAANWCSLVLDTDGNDVYVSDPALQRSSIGSYRGRKSGDGPGPCGSVMGVTILWDARGDDLYRSSRPGLASTRVGVALLVDEAGDDAYDGYTDSEGFALFGVAALIDLKGNDRYTGFNQVQACGLTGGAGMLVDVAGNDKYLADDETVDFPSPQDPKHNVSMAQGAGNGRRADFLDGLSYAGGVGVLVDGSGDDTYSCGVYGQGVGYWEGVGMLLDAEGKDAYRGQYYVQGAGTQYGVGLLDDAEGDDTYTSLLSSSQGSARDFGIGGLLDRSGNDRYEAGALSQGAADTNAIGWLLDLRGDDSYKATGASQGRVVPAAPGTLREIAFSLGLLADGAGRDTFTGTEDRADGASRTLPPVLAGDPARTQVGIFYDR